MMVSSLTPDVLLSYSQNRVLPAAAKVKLDAILAKKSEIVTVDRDLRSVETQSAEIAKDQDRLRQNINSLNRVEGQQAQVTRYASELAKQDGALAQLRDRQSELRKRRAALETELNTLIEKLEF
jgi:chromosome segregation ATPase